MAIYLTGLSAEDVAEVVDCLLLGADHTANGQISARRRDLAHSLGDALDALPTTYTNQATGTADDADER
ncbi:hypothetical protein ACFW91_28585 [Streptomyces asoensis]|uniref:hypothetical protein n=1 Tax=Streptomyces asoensis TaxID=249586 RepID=UPI00368A4F12